MRIKFGGIAEADDADNAVTFGMDAYFKKGMYLPDGRNVPDAISEVLGVEYRNVKGLMKDMGSGGGAAFVTAKVSVDQDGREDVSLSNIKPIQGATSVTVTAIGKNAMSYPYRVQTSTANGGIVYTVNDDGTIHASGTPVNASAWSNFQLHDYNKKGNGGMFALPAGRWKLVCEGSKNTNKLYVTLYIRNKDNSGYSSIGQTRGVTEYSFATTEYSDRYYVLIACAPGYAPDDETLKVMIVPEDADSEYESYEAQELTYDFEEPTISAEVDFTAGRVTTDWKYMELTGNENWKGYKGTAGNWIAWMRPELPAEYTPGNEIGNAICDRVASIPANDISGSAAGGITTVYNEPIVITAEPVDSVFTLGSSMNFSVVATGEELTYQWEYRTTPTGGWANSTSSAAKSANFTYSPSRAYHNGYQYRCVITDAHGNKVKTNIATAIIAADGTKPVVITAEPANITLPVDSVALFTVAAKGNGLTYRWEFKSSANDWQPSGLTGYNTAQISVGVTTARNGYKYRCVITDQSGNTVTSREASLATTTQAAPTLQVLANPTNQVVKANDTIKFSVAAKGEGLTYQWEYSVNGGASWMNNTMSGNTSTELTFAVKSYHNGYLYRCRITDSNGEQVVSNNATIVVLTDTSFALTASPIEQTGRENQMVYFSIATAGENFTYQWQW